MSILFLTGAGISANAGIPTYRDNGSTWRDKDLEAKSHSTRYGNHLDELWNKHWGPLSIAMEQGEPTVAHKAIADFQRGREVIIATQNIDTLHERAGSDNIAHLHGTMDTKCIRCRKRVDAKWSGNGTPPCPECGKPKTRPDVVLFGENLSSRMFDAIDNFSRKCTHVIAVGTSLNVFPASGLILDNLGKTNVIIVNKQPTPFDKWATRAVQGDADLVLPEILADIDRELSA